MKSDRQFQQEKMQNNIFAVFFLIMVVYYGYRMFALTPWYDELYTYYCFISKGPLYAAIHWPLPNNHVGYSVLSACLNVFGNPYIGLRGVSYICALSNLCLIYIIANRYLKGWMPICTVILFPSMGLVNQMAVQGRGYTMGITCFLITWLCLIHICEDAECSKWIYLIYVLALILGLYTVSSNVYWVIPLCMAGGSYLLLKAIWEGKEKKSFFLKASSGKKLIKLITASLIAALGTIFLYATIWIAIGSNLLVKDENSGYYGMGHVQMILKAPFAAIGRGMQYMLDTPYIQSEERAGFLGRFLEWIVTLSGYFYQSLTWFVVAVWIVGVLFLACKIIKLLKKKESEDLLLFLILFMGILFIPICLLIQCKRPYYRVFTYVGVLLALLLGVLIQKVTVLFGKRAKDKKAANLVAVIVFGLTVIFGVKCFFFSGYNGQYGINEYEIQDAFSHGNIEKWENFCVTDCNQEYLLYFLYGIRCENREIEGSDLVLLDKRMTEPDFDEMVWEFYHYYNTIPWDYIEQNMTKTYENENYILYTRNQ